MAFTFVGSYASTHAATSAQSIALSNLRDENNAQPTLQENDCVFVGVENASTLNRSTGGGADVLVPSGYAGLGSHDYQNDSNDSNFRVSRKFMGPTPDTTIDIPASNATTAGVAYAISVWRGIDPTTPLDVAVVAAGAINTGVANGGAVVPVTPGALILVFAGAAVAAGAVFTNPAGMSATTNHFRSATITSTTNDANIAVAAKTDWTSGSFDPAVFGGSTSTNTGSWSALTIAVRPTLDPVVGTFAATEAGADSATAAGLVLVQGALAATESGSDAFAASGTVADASVSGSLAAVETGSDSAALTGVVPIRGSAAATEAGADTLAASGTVPISGALSTSEAGSDTFAAAGQIRLSGAVAATEAGSDTLSAVGAVRVAGSLAATEAGSDTAAISGSGATPSITGSLAATEAGADSAALTGAVIVSGAMAVAETGQDTAALVGQVRLVGGLDVTEAGADVAALAGAVRVAGTFAATEAGADTFAASSTVTVRLQYPLAGVIITYPLFGVEIHYPLEGVA